MKDNADPQRIPGFGLEKPKSGRTLDVGCGTGWLLAGQPVHGVDIDFDALRKASIPVAAAEGERLPFRARSYDRVVARVSLPYMDIPKAVAEFCRVLRSGGSVWLTVHPAHAVLKWLVSDLRHLRPLHVIHWSFVLVNGLIFHFSGRFLHFHRCYETWQSARAIRRALIGAGFHSVTITRGREFVVTAIKG